MNPFSQTRILLMYLILISEGLSPPPTPCLPSHPLSPSSLLGSAHVSRAEIFPLSLPPYFPQYSSPPSSLPLHLLSLPPLIPSRHSLLSCPSFWTWVSNWKCVYQQAISDGRKIVAHSGNPETSIKQSPYALPTELFRPMRVTGFNLYLYIMTAFSSLRGCVIHIIISI